MTAPSFLASSVYVALGGSIGAWLRFLVGRGVVRRLGPEAASAFPWATLGINIAGSFAMGLLVGWLARQGDGGESLRLLLGVGVLGGFTTFSAFSLEVVQLAQRGSVGLSVLYALGSVLAGIAGLLAGLALVRAAA